MTGIALAAAALAGGGPPELPSQVRPVLVGQNRVFERPGPLDLGDPTHETRRFGHSFGQAPTLALDLSMNLRVRRIYQRRSTGTRMNVCPTAPRTRRLSRLPLSRLASDRRLTPASLGPRRDLQSPGHRPSEASPGPERLEPT